MDIFAGRKIHDRVGTPFRGPPHFLNLFLDRTGDGRVTNVGIDLHEEIATDDHRLAFWMIDVGRNNGPPTSNFITDKLGRDMPRDCGSEGVATKIARTGDR